MKRFVTEYYSFVWNDPKKMFGLKNEVMSLHCTRCVMRFSPSRYHWCILKQLARPSTLYLVE